MWSFPSTDFLSGGSPLRELSELRFANEWRRLPLLGALSAMARMGEAVGEQSDAAFYADLAKRCAQFLDEQLFNGEYYQQKIQYQGLRDNSFANSVANVDDKSSEMQKLLKREGPRYQYGTGCLSEGVIGAWMARTYGIATPLLMRTCARPCRLFSSTTSNSISVKMRMRNGRVTPWVWSPGCSYAVGPTAASPLCRLSILMRCGRGSNSRWLLILTTSS